MLSEYQKVRKQYSLFSTTLNPNVDIYLLYDK